MGRTWWAALLVMVAAAWPAFACDEVTHARMTDLAVDAVTDMQLRELLDRHRGIVRFGSWYPDWGQYNDHPFTEYDHWQTPVLYAYLDYLRTPAARQRLDYEELVAHFLGASAHSIQDQYYDSLFMERLKEVDHGEDGDMEMGILNIRRGGYLTVQVEPFIPSGALAAVYERAGLFERTSAGRESFSRDIVEGTRIQFLQMRGLKLLSFLASGNMQRTMPWAAANIRRAPGGMLDAARITARYWEALWEALAGGEPALFIASYPQDGAALLDTDPAGAYGRVALVSHREVTAAAFAPEAVTVTQNRRLVPGRVVQRKESDEHGMNVVHWRADQPLEPGRGYTLTVHPGRYGFHRERLVKPFRVRFSVEPAAGSGR